VDNLKIFSFITLKYGKFEMKNIYTLCSSAFFYISICFFAIGGCERYSDQIQANLYKLKSTKSCSGCDLTGGKLVGFNLRNAKLNGFANLSNVDLTEADLSGAELTGAKLTDANLTGSNLTGANLTGANLTDAKLDGVILTDAQDTMLFD
jgi:uncharacterized protein YjbI with pentapeptide repeats